MKYIKLFEYYQDVDTTCKQYKIENYTVNNKDLVDVYSTVNISKCGLHYIPLNFGKIDGDFYCSYNSIDTLKGCPIEISGVFGCESSELNSLKYSPLIVGSGYMVQNNNIKSLKYMTDNIGGYIFIDYNPLPKEILDNENYIEKIVKYQNEYKIWNNDETLNLPRFKIMMDEEIN